MDNFDFHKWTPPVITSCQELTDQLRKLALIGKCIWEIWNIGIIFNEDAYNDGIMFVELDELIIFVFDDFNLEILLQMEAPL